MIDVSKYIGIPYQDRNCYDLFRDVQKEFFGVDLPEEQVPSRLPDIMSKLDKHDERENWERVSEYQDGDAVLMKRLGANHRPSHIGVWINGMILHTVEGMGCHMVKVSDLYVLGVEIYGVYRRK